MNAIKPPVAPATTGNVYELRNYRAKPLGAVKQWLEAFTAALPAREKYSKMVGLWQTEAPQPNEVCHIWAYPSLNARAEVRANAARGFSSRLTKALGASRAGGCAPSQSLSVLPVLAPS